MRSIKHQALTLRISLLVVIAGLLISSAALAGTQKIKIKGSVEEVTVQVDGVFEELNIDQADTTRSDNWATTSGKSASGAEVTVSVNMSDKDECEVTISSASPADPEIERRFLRLMQSR